MSDYSDQALTVQLTGNNKGAGRAASYLLDITGENREELRSWAYSAGIVMSNTSPGYRMADGVGVMARNVVNNGWTVEKLKNWYQNNR